MGRFDLTDFEWSAIEPLLPNKVRRVARVDDRRVFEWDLLAASDRGALGGHPRTLWAAHDLRQPLQPRAPGGCPGSVSGCCFEGLRPGHPNDRLVVDPRPSAWRKRPKKDGRSRCMGRSRGGLTTKFHALVDAEGLPIAPKLNEGQAHDGRCAREMLDRLSEGQILLADRAYDADELRVSLKQHGALANIKPMPNRKNISAFSPWLYRFRSLVERFFNKLKHFRAVATHTTNAMTTSWRASNSRPFESCADLNAT
jgi:transposase